MRINTDQEIEEPQTGLSAHTETDSSRSRQAEVESTSDLSTATRDAEQESSTAPPKSPKPSKPPRDERQSRLLASIATLKSKIATAESQLSVKTQEITELQSFQQRQQEEVKDDSTKSALAHAQVIANRNISLLKRYNEIRDIAMGMLSLIAEKEGKRLAEVMEERGVSEKD